MINASASSRCYLRSSIQRSTRGYPLQMMPKCSRRIRRKWTWDVITKQMEKAKDALQNSIYGCFLKWWYPTTVGFPTKNDPFGVFSGCPYFWKHSYTARQYDWTRQSLCFNRHNQIHPAMLLNATGTKNADESCKNFKTNNICIEDDQATSSRPQCQCFVSASRGLVNMCERSTSNWGKKIWSVNHNHKSIHSCCHRNILKLTFLLGT